ncbi:Kelch repeat-containing protein [Streptomyces sp. HUAS TT11]|uniref:Kelch repeat-containing protein n=1 Tax=Streptomyces sp. HUAS TT11 TaxID=3447508 RepID=UPI003F656451
MLFAMLLAPLFALTPTLANAQGVWLTLPHLNTARQSLAGATAPCPKGVAGLSGTCVYAIGGNDGTGVVGTVEAYSPATNRWVALPSMPTARQSLAGAAAPCPKSVAGLSGTCVYAIGGTDGAQPSPNQLNTVEAYSPATNAWVTLPPMHSTRDGLAGATAPCPKGVAGLSGTCVYAVGGANRSAGATQLNTVEAYSPATNLWVTLPSMPTARTALAGAAAPCPQAVAGGGSDTPREPGGRRRADPDTEERNETCVYAYGGFPGGGAPDDLHRAAETYVPTANVWATLPLMPTARQDLAGAAAPCPRAATQTCVYAVGGIDNGVALGTLEAYIPTANVWATLPSMPTSRFALAGTAAPCPDDLDRTCVYAIGGRSDGVLPQDTVEAFDIEK